MTRAEMEAIARMSTEEYSRWLIGSQHAMFRAAAARQDVPRTVTAMHDRQRNTEPPRPYANALEVRGAAAGTPHAASLQVLRDADGVPKPWSSALAARRAAEGR